MLAHRTALPALLIVASSVACDESPAPGAPVGSATVSPGSVVAAASEPAPSATSSARAASEPTVAIPAGRFVAGSVPGDPGRDAVLEPAELPVELGAFDIDRLPFPNELGAPPKLVSSRKEAAEACAARGRRLCSELEWERACKGPDGTPYPGSEGSDPRCATEPEACASGYGVLALGSMREWTASDVAAVREHVTAGAAVRGAAKGAASVERRCAHRASVAEADAADVGFRCCGGTPNEAAIPAPEAGKTWERTELPAASLASLIAGVKELRGLTGDPLYFDEESAKEVVGRGDAGDASGYELTTAPLLWRPVPGEEVLLVTARAGNDSFVLAFHRLREGRHRLASSLVLKGDRGPVVLAYDVSVAGRLEWATCWRCPGEGGRITFRDRGRVVITQE